MLVRKTCVFIVFHARPPLVFSIQGDQVPMVVYTSAIFSCNDMVLALQWLYYTSACVPPNPRHSIPAYTALWQQCPPPPAPCACSSTGVTGRGRRMPRGGGHRTRARTLRHARAPVEACHTVHAPTQVPAPAVRSSSCEQPTTAPQRRRAARPQCCRRLSGVALLLLRRADVAAAPRGRCGYNLGC